LQAKNEAQVKRAQMHCQKICRTLD